MLPCVAVQWLALPVLTTTGGGGGMRSVGIRGHGHCMCCVCFVLLCSVIICRLYKLTLSDQFKSLQRRVRLCHLAERFLAGPPEKMFTWAGTRLQRPWELMCLHCGRRIECRAWGFLCFTSVSPVECLTKAGHATPLLSVPHFIRYSLSSHQMTCATEKSREGNENWLR